MEGGLAERIVCPAHPGHLYGIQHFDWHFQLPPPHPGCTANCTTPQTYPNPCPDCDAPQYGDPIDPSSGLVIINNTDISFENSRARVAVTRTFRGLSGVAGPFGNGTSHNYNYSLDLRFASTIPGASGSIALNMPDGNQFFFVGNAGGSYTNTTVPSLSGAVLTDTGGGGFSLRWKDGTTFQFCQCAGGFVPIATVTGILDTNGNKITLARDIANQNLLDRVTDPVGRFLNFRYDPQGRITSITDSIGRMVSYSYNPQGMLETVTDLAGGRTTYEYDPNNNLTKITDPNGHFYQNSYDPAGSGRVVKQTAPDSGVTQFSYQLLNSSIPNSPVNLATVTDPRGNTTTYHFNPQGFLLDVTDAMGQKTVRTVDPTTNKVASETDALGRSTTYTYDSAGNTKTITHLAGTSSAATTTFEYDPTFNKITTVTDALGHATISTYDPNTGNLLSVTDPLGHVTRYDYDLNGQLQKIIDPTGKITQFAYNNGDLKTSTDPLGRVVTRVADGIGRAAAVSNALGQTTQYQWDAMDRPVQATDPLGNATFFDYDAKGNILRVTDSNQHTVLFTYDPMDRLSGHTDSLGHSDNYQYDLSGNLIQITDRRGKITRYDYDSLDRRTAANFGQGESVLAFNYDPVNRLVSATDSSTGTIFRDFDGLDRLVGETTPQGKIVYSYDPVGRRTTMQVAGRAAVAYSYDDNDHLTSVSQGTASVSLAYDLNGRRSALTLPNGTSLTYGYDDASELTSINYQSGSATLGNLTYAYDLAGRRTTVGGSLAQTALPSTVPSATYNAANQLTQWGSRTVSFDANGNLVSDGTNTYGWDARDNLVSIAGALSLSYGYDALGRRVRKTVNGQSMSYLYDGTNEVQESIAGVPTVDLLGGLTADEYFERRDLSGTVDVLSDALGSTIALSGLGATAQYAYEPFGNAVATGTSANTYEYTGRINEGLGIYYYRARYYAAQFGRFLSEDPAGVTAGTNLYEYAKDNPLSFVDPLGLCPQGTKEATPDQINKILDEAGKIVGEKKKYNEIVCNQFLAKAINQAFPGAIKSEYNTRQIRAGMGPFEPASGPARGEVALFSTPGHVVIVSQTAGGQVTQFVGSQSSTGPHFVNLPDHYWQGKLDAPDNVQFFKICLP